MQRKIPGREEKPLLLALQCQASTVKILQKMQKIDMHDLFSHGH